MTGSRCFEFQLSTLARELVQHLVDAGHEALIPLITEIFVPALEPAELVALAQDVLGALAVHLECLHQLFMVCLVDVHWQPLFLSEPCNANASWLHTADRRARRLQSFAYLDRRAAARAAVRRRTHIGRKSMADAKQQLIEFLNRKVFDSVLHASESGKGDDDKQSSST